jgi:saccharopine dehydrogenase-like NADP-dependent oxidoreductase
MKKVLILGANGQIARFAIDLFLEKTDFELTLFARRAGRLRDLEARSKRIQVVEGRRSGLEDTRSHRGRA